MSPARTAAEVASLLPIDHPMASVARLRLDALVRQEKDMATVQAPDPTFTGTSVGAAFVDGKAKTNDEAAINYFRSAGYFVDDTTDWVAPVVENIDPRQIDTVRINPYPEQA